MISSKEALILSSGNNGAKLLTSNDETFEGNFFAILALEDDTEISEETLVSKGDVPVGYSLSKGTYLILPFNSIKLSSGSVLAYPR